MVNVASQFQSLQHSGTTFCDLWVFSLTCEASRPYFDMMSLWVYEGRLQDPYNEFFVPLGRQDDIHGALPLPPSPKKGQDSRSWNFMKCNSMFFLFFMACAWTPWNPRSFGTECHQVIGIISVPLFDGQLSQCDRVLVGQRIFDAMSRQSALDSSWLLAEAFHFGWKARRISQGLIFFLLPETTGNNRIYFIVCIPICSKFRHVIFASLTLSNAQSASWTDHRALRCAVFLRQFGHPLRSVQGSSAIPCFQPRTYPPCWHLGRVLWISLNWNEIEWSKISEDNNVETTKRGEWNMVLQPHWL